MSFFSSVVGAVKKVGKVATLPITAPIKLQAQIASKLLPTVARALPGPSIFGSSAPRGAPPAAPASVSTSSTSPGAPPGWRANAAAVYGSPPPASSTSPYDQATPAHGSWFPSIASAVQATPPSPYGTPLPYGTPAPSPYYPGAAPAPYVPGGVPGGTPLSYAQPSYQPPSGGGGYGGGGYGGGSYGGGGGYDDGLSVPDDGSLYSAATDADVYDQGDAELADLDAYAQLGDDGAGLGDWKSALTNIVKGAASGALTQTVSALTPKPAAPKPGLLSGGMSTGAKVAIGAAVAAPLLYLALRHRGAPTRARNPRRRRRRRTSRRR